MQPPFYKAMPRKRTQTKIRFGSHQAKRRSDPTVWKVFRQAVSMSIRSFFGEKVESTTLVDSHGADHLFRKTSKFDSLVEKCAIGRNHAPAIQFLSPIFLLPCHYSNAFFAMYFSASHFCASKCQTSHNRNSKLQLRTPWSARFWKHNLIRWPAGDSVVNGVVGNGSAEQLSEQLKMLS